MTAPLYLYAVVAPRPRAALGRGIHRRPLEVLRIGRAYVVLERGRAPEPTASRVVAHDRVVRRIARAASAVLPLRFASTATDEAAVRALFAPLAAQLERALERVRGAVQFTLRVRGRPARAPVLRGGPGTRWLAARHTVPEIDPLTDATRPFVRASRVERKVRDGELATVYHLVPRPDVDAWTHAVSRARTSLRRAHASSANA